MLLRFVRFNLVGAIGSVVQLASVQLLVGVLHLHYLAGTLIAVEISILHNFAWHERWTWRQRATPSSRPRWLCERPAAPWDVASARAPDPRGCVRAVCVRCLAFHAGNGLVSLLGSLALVPVFVEALRLPYLLANLGSIAASGILNFLVADRLVFRRRHAGSPPRAGSALLVAAPPPAHWPLS